MNEGITKIFRKTVTQYRKPRNYNYRSTHEDSERHDAKRMNEIQI